MKKTFKVTAPFGKTHGPKKIVEKTVEAYTAAEAIEILAYDSETIRGGWLMNQAGARAEVVDGNS